MINFSGGTLGVQIGLLLATIAAFSAAAYYAHIAYKQWEVMEKTYGEIQKQTASAKESASAARNAAEIADKTLNLTQRPWLSVRLSAGSGLEFREEGGTVFIVIKVKNIGHSPALNIFPNAKIVLLTGKQDLAAEQKRIFATPQPPYQPKTLSFGYAVFPDEELALTFPFFISRQDIEKSYATRHTSFITPVLVGCVSYKFAFSESIHKTGFIVMINRLNPSQPVPDARFAILPEAGNVPANLLILDTFPNGSYAD